MSTYHTPVLLREVIEGLTIVSGKRYIDATLGGGGHGIEIMKRGGMLLGIDTDPEAIEYARQFSNSKWKIVEGNFRNIEAIARENGFSEVDGMLFDLGVSSHQLDEASRGFSYRDPDAPLDLRLSQKSRKTGSDLLKNVSEEELYEIIARFGEEQLALPIARAIVRARKVAPIITSGQLAEIVRSIERDDKKIKGVLSRVFQAIRIVINDELSALDLGLQAAGRLIRSGGRLAVISYHSLEDRRVKQYMKSACWNLIVKHPIVPKEAELEQNPRSRSAKLRIAEKI